MKYCIGDIAKLVFGVNQTRNDNSKQDTSFVFYDQKMFDYHFQHMYESNESVGKKALNQTVIQQGDVVISQSLQMATIISEMDVLCLLSVNFIRVELIDSIDKAFFVYMYNLNKDVKRQKDRLAQGTTTIQRIPTKEMNLIEMEIPSIEVQKQIGKAYLEMLKIKNNVERFGELIEKYTQIKLDKRMEVISNGKK